MYLCSLDTRTRVQAKGYYDEKILHVVDYDTLT